MGNAELPTVYERWNYNGKSSLVAGERDRILLVLNRIKHLERSAGILGVEVKTLLTLRLRHRISKDRYGVWSSENIWPE